VFILILKEQVKFLKADQGFRGYYPMPVFFMMISRLMFCLIDSS